MEQKLQTWSIRIFAAVFSVIWAWVWYTAVVQMNQTKRICLLAAGLLAAALAAAWAAEAAARRVKDRKRFYRSLTGVTFLFMAAGLLYAGMELRVYPGWDFGAVYQGAVDLAENGMFSAGSNEYFTAHPNNLALCMLLAAFFLLFRGVAHYITLGVLLNVGLILLGLFFLYVLAEKLYGSRAGFFLIFCCAFFLPFYMHVPIFYTDTFALPFVTGAFLSYLNRKQDARWLILTAAVLAIGYKVKGSLGVILIALLIHLWLHRETAAERLKKSLLLLIPFLLLVGTLTVLPEQLPFFDASEKEKNEIPVEHWIATGLAGNGGYNAEIYWMTVSTEGLEGKKAVTRQFIRETLEEYGVSGMLQHLNQKIVFTWGDGVYFAPEKLKRDPVNESALHAWVLYDGEHYTATYLYCNAVQLLILGGILLSLLCTLRKKGEAGEIQAVQLAVFGLFLFLLIWETRSRYLVNFVPLFLLLGMDGARELRSLFLGKRLTADVLQGLRRRNAPDSNL